jgi:acyl-coenzyme A thioesterase PaaI-like protein
MDLVAREVVEANFARQPAMALIGAAIAVLEPGLVEVAFPFRVDLTQQDGFVHAGIICTAADSACGYAALSSMPAGSQVLKPGKTLTAVRADVFAFIGDKQRLIAAMQATMIRRGGSV